MEIRKRVLHNLILANEYISLVKSSIKRSTVRLGYNFIDNEEITITPAKLHEPGEILKVKFRGLQIIPYGELTIEHALLDGFNNLEELQEAIEKFYGQVPPDYPMTIIHFSYT